MKFEEVLPAWRSGKTIRYSENPYSTIQLCAFALCSTIDLSAAALNGETWEIVGEKKEIELKDLARSLFTLAIEHTERLETSDTNELAEAIWEFL